MTSETRKRINAYKKALPELRERVIAVALLLAMSVSMLGSASFAWITLSAAPETTGMQTTVAANGNLEIALAQGSTVSAAVAPGESQVGDSSAAEDQTIVDANITWGNLINVSDPTYGLSEIALRPALLSDYNRTEYPLNGATYGGDGRVVSTYDRYEYASYTQVEGSDLYQFTAGNKVNYGVRAISSVGYSNAAANVRIDNYRNTTTQYYRDAQTKYGKIVSDGDDAYVLNEASGVTCISALEGLVTVFAQDKINQMGYGPDGDSGVNSKTSCSQYLPYVFQMMCLLEEVLIDEGNALLTLANWQAYVESGDLEITTTFTTINDLLNASKATLEEKGVKITTLANYKRNLEDLRDSINGLRPISEASASRDVFWDEIAEYIAPMVDINSTTINDRAMSEINGVTAAMDVLGGGDVIVHAGMLKDIELRTISNDKRVRAKVKVKVKTNIPLFTNTTVEGTVYTAAYGESPTYGVDIDHADKLESGSKGDAVAKDTYGMAIDLWIRTNYPSAVLTLEGSVKYTDQRATITVQGTTYDLYTIMIGVEETQVEADVYQVGDTWYYADTQTEVDSEDMEGKTPREKFNQVIVGYEGENRIWEDWRDLLENGYIEQDATTQGAGSCFVFYANTPTEQLKIMEMLEAFNVAFIDQNGDSLGTAKLNLDKAYANQGKVTVPLEMDTGIDYTDEEGNTAKGITTLVQNTPTMITAIVYLNGSKIKNENVLSAGELQGQLNIQFGTDGTLIAPVDEELMAQSRSITAEVTVGDTTISDGTIGGTEGLDYRAEGYTATVTLTVEGDQPERISGFFVRRINDTQGTRGEEKDFTYNAETGKWTANFTLTNPGTHILNMLTVDGVQYSLHDGTQQSGLNEYYPSNRPKVYIKGLNLNSVTVDKSPGTQMYTDTSVPFEVTANIYSAVEPRQVTAQFFSLDNTKQYTAILSRSGDTWVGTANITSSGTYQLKYISVDGQIMEVPTMGTYTIYLGLTADVSTTVPVGNRQWDFVGGAVQLPMKVQLYDDQHDPIVIELDEDETLKLYYHNIISPAELEWDGSSYTGVLNATRPGNMTFHYVDLGDLGTVTRAPGAPQFRAISLETPKFLSAAAPEKMTIISGGNAEINLTMDDAESAVIWAELTRTLDEGKTYETRYIKAEQNNEDQNLFKVTLPREDGVWTLQRLLLQDVYDQDFVNSDGTKGKWYEATEGQPTDESKYYIIAMGDTQKKSIDVVTQAFVDMFYDQDGNGVIDYTMKAENDEWIQNDRTIAFGGTKENPTGTFMQSHKSNILALQVVDYAGRAIDGLKDRTNTWTIQYKSNTSEAYGGYTGTSDQLNAITLMPEPDGKAFIAPVQTFTYAGEYVRYGWDLGDGISAPEQTVKFTVASIKPTVTVSAVTPTTENMSTTIKYDDKGYIVSYELDTPKTNGFDAQNKVWNVYARAADSGVPGVSTGDAGFECPTVKFNVAGIDADSTVKFTIPKGDASAAISVSKKGNGDSTVITLGNATGKAHEVTYGVWIAKVTYTCFKYLGHGEFTISQITIERGGNTYSVTLDSPITIKNPSSIPTS